MRLWLAGKWDDVRTSFWFVPTVMVAAAMIAVVLLVATGVAAVGGCFRGDRESSDDGGKRRDHRYFREPGHRTLSKVRID